MHLFAIHSVIKLARAETLTYVMTSTIKRPSLRQTKHLAYIAEFTTDISYVKSKTNVVADSRDSQYQ